MQLRGSLWCMKSIFITGAASGIGKATAWKFLSEGWTVGAYDLAEVEWADNLPPAQQSRVHTGYLDVTDENSWQEALAEFASKVGGHIDVLDNNAGIIISGPVAEEDPNRIRKILDVNALGVTFGARYGHRYLRGGGHLVNISSASAIFGQPDITVYSATKFYVEGLTEGLGQEWRKDKIRVTTVAPLWTDTKLAEADARSIDKLGVNITPEEVATQVWRSVTTKNPWRKQQIHFGVSLVEKALRFSRRLAPDQVVKVVMRFIA